MSSDLPTQAGPAPGTQPPVPAPAGGGAVDVYSGGTVDSVDVVRDGGSPVPSAGDAPVLLAGDAPVPWAGDAPVLLAGDAPVPSAGEAPVSSAEGPVSS